MHVISCICTGTPCIPYLEGVQRAVHGLFAQVDSQHCSCKVHWVGRAADRSPTRRPRWIFRYFGGLVQPIPLVLAKVACVRGLTDDTSRDCGCVRRHMRGNSAGQTYGSEMNFDRLKVQRYFKMSEETLYNYLLMKHLNIHVIAHR